MWERFLRAALPMLSLGYGLLFIPAVPSYRHNTGELLVAAAGQAAIFILPFGMFVCLYARMLFMLSASARGRGTRSLFVIPLGTGVMGMVVTHALDSAFIYTTVPMLAAKRSDGLILSALVYLALWVLGLWLLEDGKLTAHKVAGMMAHQAKKPA